MTWAELNWPALDRLRAKFIQGVPSDVSYWESTADLANYDFTYGERIGWKWDHVLRELQLREWRPQSRAVFDWGCGSGVAARRVIEFFGVANFDSLTVWDHSALACDYAAATAEEKFPSIRVAQATPGLLSGSDPIGLLVVSHVLNELTPAALTELQMLITRADSVLWVEPGTHAVSRQLSGLRDSFRASFRIVAPCTHGNRCPVLLPENERHWCHFFAPPPSEIFADSNWVKFGQRAGIDLRSLPYCFVALDRTSTSTRVDETLSRVIGRSEHFKPYARLLNCDASGLNELELPKRANPALYKELERSKAPLVYRWQRNGAKITDGEAAKVSAP